MAGLHSTPRFVEHERLVAFTMYDGGRDAVERYLGASIYDAVTRLLADCTDIDPMIVHNAHDVVDYWDTAAAGKKRRIVGTTVKLHPLDSRVTEENCLAAASVLVDAFAVCGKAFSDEAAGREIDSVAIQQQVFADLS